MAPSRPRYFFIFFYPEFLALVLSPTNPVQQLTFLLSISADGKESPLLFWGPSQSFGFYLLPSRVRRPEWGHQVKTSGFHCDPHSFLTVILWWLATVNWNTRIVVILFLSSQWETTWQYHNHVMLQAWIFLPHLNHPSLPASPIVYILCPYRAVVDKSLLVVQHLHVRVKVSLGKRRLWVRSYFSTLSSRLGR